MEQKQQKIQVLFRKDILIHSNSTHQNFLKKGYRVVPKLRIKLDNSYPHEIIQRKIKILKLLKKVKTIKKLDITQFFVPYTKPWGSYIAKRIASLSCLKSNDKGIITSWSKYMKHLKSFSYPAMINREKKIHYRHERNYQQKRELAKGSSCYFKFLPRLEVTTVEIDFPSNIPSDDVNSFWKLEKHPASVKKLCFYGTQSFRNLLNISIDHLKNLKELRFEFGSGDENFSQARQAVASVLLQVTQIEALHVDFLEDFEIDVGIFEALKKFRNLKKARFSLNWEHQSPHNIKILESLEDLPFEDLDFRVTIKENESLIQRISDFLTKKKNLENLKIRISNASAWKDLKPIEDLLRVVNDLPQLTSFSILTMVDPRGSFKSHILPEIDLSFDKLLSRSIPLKKFRISLHQHRFSQSGFMKLLGSLKGVAPTLDKLRIDVGEYTPKTIAETEVIIDFIKSLTKIRSLKLYSMDIPLKSFFSELSEAIESLKFVRIICLGEISAKVTRLVLLSGMKRILYKQGLEKFSCSLPDGFCKTLGKNTAFHQNIDLEELRVINPSLQSWPNGPIYQPPRVNNNLW